MLTNSNSFYAMLLKKYFWVEGGVSQSEKKDWVVLGLSWELILFLNLLISFPSLSVKAAVELEKDRLILF